MVSKRPKGLNPTGTKGVRGISMNKLNGSYVEGNR